MAMTCNIDSRGRLIRALIGAVFIVAALILVFALPPAGWRRALVVVLTLGGIFCLFEARAGWCAVRAMGMKTRI
jgi:hypothetical protein